MIKIWYKLRKLFLQLLYKIKCSLSVWIMLATSLCSPCPSPCLKGDLIPMHIPEKKDIYDKVWKCKNHLHDMIVLVKGYKSLPHLDMCKKLNVAWKALISLKAIPFSKEFYEFSFTSLEDTRNVLAVGSWNLFPRFLRVFTYTKDFVSITIKFTKAQCWVRIHGLPLEYWQPCAIFSIARGVGTPRVLDDCTMKKIIGSMLGCLLM